MEGGAGLSAEEREADAGVERRTAADAIFTKRRRWRGRKAFRKGRQNLYFLALKAYQDAGDQAAAAELAAEAATRFPESARAQFERGYYLQKGGNTEAGMKY